MNVIPERAAVVALHVSEYVSYREQHADYAEEREREEQRLRLRGSPRLRRLLIALLQLVPLHVKREGKFYHDYEGHQRTEVEAHPEEALIVDEIQRAASNIEFRPADPWPELFIQHKAGELQARFEYGSDKVQHDQSVDLFP